ncbi:ornithine cyclodeaminase family protein [Candidatus Bathyarchaeota archaeon]|nr:MAG: ornithine cyclodeaminase family protein [Candidatus Bathyarchaeota archaeon]
MEDLKLVLLIRDSDVRLILDFKEAIEAVEACFKEYAKGMVWLPQRLSLNLNKFEGWFSVMPTYLLESNVLTVKLVSSYPKNIFQGKPNISAILAYIEPSTGIPLALMEASYLTTVRTAAASAVATKYLARREASVLGVFGSGVQAKGHVEALASIKNFNLVKVYSPNPEHRDKFSAMLKSKLKLNIIPVKKPEDAAKNTDIIITATTSKNPVFLGEWVNIGVHINSIGAHTPDARELDDVTIKKAKIVVDCKEAALNETGDLIIPIKKGIIDAKSIYAELGEVVSGLKPGREFDEEITLFKSVGLAMEDAAVAKIVYEKAKKRGLGLEVKLED